MSQRLTPDYVGAEILHSHLSGFSDTYKQYIRQLYPGLGEDWVHTLAHIKTNKMQYNVSYPNSIEQVLQEVDNYIKNYYQQ